MSKQTEALKLALEALEKCDSALAEELSAWDIDPPLHHVLEASNACGPAITAIREALASEAYEQPAQQGWKLVPVEPTPEMLKAADDGDDEYTRRNFGPAVHRVMQGPYDHYIAMLNAAPQPAQQQEPVALRQLVEQALKGDLSGDSDADLALILKARKELAGIASPPASKPWVGLTYDDLDDIADRWATDDLPDIGSVLDCAENKLKEKNA